MKTKFKPRFLQLLYSKFFGKSLQQPLQSDNEVSTIEGFTPTEFISNLKSIESIYSLSFYISDTDCDDQQIPKEQFEESVNKLTVSIIDAIGGLTVQNATGYYKTIEGKTITEQVKIFSMYFFDPSIPIQKLECIFNNYFEYARWSRQESVLMSVDNRTMIIYI